MTDDATTAANVDRLAMITTKIERESRFTRSLVVICTAANLAIYVFGMIKLYEVLPPLVLAHFMEHMSEVILTQRMTENALNHNKSQIMTPGATPAK